MKSTPRPPRNQGKTIWDIAGYVLMGALCIMLGFTAFNFLGGMLLNKMKGDGSEEAAPKEEQVVDAPPSNESGETAETAPAVVPAALVGKPATSAKTSKAYTTCVACHGADGKGLPGLPDKPMAPALVGSEIMLGNDEQVVVAVLKGIAQSGDYLNIMLSQEPLLDDEAIANAVTHARNSWGNEAGVVTAERVAEIRARWVDYPVNITRENLAKIPAEAESLLGGE